jgi:outer membrane protein
MLKEYGREKGYDYIYGSGEASPSILYAKDNYDITAEIIKKVNDKYKSTGKKESETKEAKK